MNEQKVSFFAADTVDPLFVVANNKTFRSFMGTMWRRKFLMTFLARMYMYHLGLCVGGQTCPPVGSRIRMSQEHQRKLRHLPVSYVWMSSSVAGNIHHETSMSSSFRFCAQSAGT